MFDLITSSQYQQIIQELAHEISTLKDQRNDLESRISHLDPRLNAMNGEDKMKLEEALKLRESLLQSFKQQINLRKNVLELDNAIMDLSIEVDRHMKIIESTSTSSIKENSTDSVLNSKEELKVVEQDKEELEMKRSDVLKELEQCKAKTRKLRDIASKKLNNHEQKEILGLLLKNFEFEMKNIEMQANIFKRDFKLREQDMVILRLEQHRSLCDTLIFQQRRLIIDNNLQIPSDLDELYFLYSRDVNDGQLMKDLTGTRSTSNSSLATNSPKPNASTFLTQIQEESSTTPSNNNYDDFNNLNDIFINKVQPNPWTKKNMDKADYEKKKLEQERIFQMSNKAPQNRGGFGVNNKNKSKDANLYTMNTGNFISGNGAGGLVTTNVGPQSGFNSKDNKNNMSMLSSSTTHSSDNNIEVILEKVPSTNNKQLISTTTPKNINTKYDVYNSKIAPPGQVLNNNYNNSSTKNNTNSNSNANSKKFTQGIAAIAAQRKANQHHKELMQELGQIQNNNNNGASSQNESALTMSRLAKYDQSLGVPASNSMQDEHFFEKKNSILTDGSNKAKKQVKIKDIVQYKLPSENTYLSEDTSFLVSE